MGKALDVVVPDLGTFHDVPVAEVLVAVGDKVGRDEPVVVLESDKASMEVPSPATGTVMSLLVGVGTKVSTGSLLGTLDVSDEPTVVPIGGEVGDKPAPVTPTIATPAPIPPGPTVPPPEAPKPSGVSPELRPEPTLSRPGAPERPSPTAAIPLVIHEDGYAEPHASPAIRRLARELGVDLSKIHGSGAHGRIVEEDLRNFIKRSLAQPAAAPGAIALPEIPVIDYAQFGPVERKPLSRVRRLTAVSMQRSWLNVPHVTQYDEADITELDQYRREEGERRRQHRLTLLPFVMKATVATLKVFPSFNASLDGKNENLILKRYYHLGVAVDTDEGLVVPVVHDVDRKGIWDLAVELAAISDRARQHKLTPADLQGASFTISSLGSIGGTAFSPIVNAPEVAILGVSRATLRPTCWRDQISPRLILPFSLSYDHRAVDGADATRFTTYLRTLLTDIRGMLL